MDLNQYCSLYKFGGIGDSNIGKSILKTYFVTCKTHLNGKTDPKNCTVVFIILLKKYRVTNLKRGG